MGIRLIPRLDVKMSNLIKGVQMEGWRKMGDPAARAELYYSQGADELLYMDVVASLYERNNLHEIVRDVARQSFIPITVGGGISDLASAKALMDVGADKVAINTAATKRPELLRELSDTYGSQAVVLNIEAKALSGGGWTAMTDNGRNHTGRDAVAWAAHGQELGVGEILIASIDKDGTALGMDLDLIAAVAREVDVPIIASGGASCAEHCCEAIAQGAGAIALARALHSDQVHLPTLRTELQALDLDLRPFSEEVASHG